MVFRIRNAIMGFIITLMGSFIALWLFSEGEWSIWPLLGGLGALIAGPAMLWSAIRGPRRSTEDD
jgi:hypothetical protein